MGRRPPKVVRREETICWTHEWAVHQVDGVGRGVIRAIATLEHGRLNPGDVADALRRWEARARRGGVIRPHSCPDCDLLMTHGLLKPEPRALLEEALRVLPRRAKPGLQRVIWRVDEVYLRNTLPDPLADPGAPWWERRWPVGWPPS